MNNVNDVPLITAFKVDISDLKSKEVEQIIKIAEKKYGPIHMVVSCAAISKPAMFLSCDFE